MSDKTHKGSNKLPVMLAWHNPGVDRSLYNIAVGAEHPNLSAIDIAALAAQLVVESFQKGYYDRQTSARFAQLVFDGDATPWAGGKLHAERVIGFECACRSLPVGDKSIRVPRLRITAYSPVQGLPPHPEEYAEAFLGDLVLTLEHGTLIVTEATGWIGSQEVIAYLRKQFDAAVE